MTITASYSNLEADVDVVGRSSPTEDDAVLCTVLQIMYPILSVSET